MAHSIFEAHKDIYQRMKRLVSETEDHHHLIDIVDDIAIVMKSVKAPKSNPFAVVMTGKTAKAPAIMEALGRADYKFIITLNTVTWAQYTEEQMDAQLDHCLCAMQTKYNEKTDTTTYSTRKPDFIGYHGELQRHGVWRERPGGGSYPSPVEELFGEDDDDDEEGNE